MPWWFKRTLYKSLSINLALPLTLRLLRSLLVTGALATAPLASAAPFETFRADATAELKQIWETGGHDLYLPLQTHHVRRAYDPELIAAFNEKPWGLGYGRSYKDSKQGWHGLYLMAFMDSHSKVEPIAGYARLYPVLQHRDWTASLGYTAFVTARHDIGNYLPLPGVIPLASIEKGKFALMGTFIPGGHNTGNILFVFGKYSFKN